MAANIQTVTGRSKLKPRREPYWQRLSKGFYLGFRKMSADTDGAWLLRMLDETTGKQNHKTLGGFPEVAAHARFDAASREAQKWLEHLQQGGITKPKSITDVCSNYVSHIKGTKGEKAAKDIERRFKSYVIDDQGFALLPLAKLSPAHIDAWRKRLLNRPTTSGGNRGKTRSPSTLNRDMTPFRAALNLAFKEGWTTTDFPWRNKLLPLENADKRRELYLDREQRQILIEKAQPDLGLFLKALASLPVRPGALASLRVSDYDSRISQLSITVDKTGPRKITLPPSTAELFKSASLNKLPEAPLFARAEGMAWNKDSWKWPMKAAVKAAKLPAETTAYTLRHSVITDLVHSGLDLVTVAQVSGTSVRMIEKHYCHLRAEAATEALAKLAM